MTQTIKRATASLAATALVASGLAFATVTPANAEPVAGPAAECTAAETITLLGFNDFHGRIVTNRGTGALPLASTVERIRAEEGADNVSVISVGDNIGATIFESMVTDDDVAIEVLNALAIDASAIGNHELDKGWSDLSGRVSTLAEFPYLAANMTKDGAVPAPIEDYVVIEKAGLRIAIVGAVTEDTPSLVSPAGITGLTFGDPVAAVNKATEAIFAGDEADIVVATIHEGVTSEMLANLDERIAGVFNGHTHATYVEETAGGAAVVQTRSYAEGLSQIELAVDAEGNVCSSVGSNITTLDAVNAENAVVAEISALVDAAVEVAAVVGAQVIGEADAAISTPTGNADVRNTESPMTNMVAQMFFEVGGADADAVIGIQNPGGTRSSFDAGEITYKEAANTLPFANSLFTTQLTGAQVKQVLEEQWQRGADGVEFTEGRTFLQVGLSDNVSYTYDASLPLNQRITSVTVNGQPIDEAKLYTMVSGSFLISGGDNFHTFADGQNTADTGRADLEAWVGWVKEQGALSPDYSKRGVAAELPATDVLVEGGAGLTFELSDLDMALGEGTNVSPQLLNTEIVALIGDIEVGTGTVTDGVGTITVKLPKNSGVADGEHVLTLRLLASGTEVYFPVTVQDTSGPILTAIDAQTGTVGTAISIQVEATEPSVPVAFKASGLPAGVTIDAATGLISGTPTTAGTFTVSVTAVDAAGNNSAPLVFTLTVADPKPEFVRSAPYTAPGLHKGLNGRDWLTTCEKYSQTERCTTLIWATTVKQVNGQFVRENGWVFNNLTYLPFMTKTEWGANPLANTGEWTASTDGRKWRTECGTAATGRDGCRTYAMVTVYKATPRAQGGYTFSQNNEWVFNNIVMFGDFAK